MIKYLCRQIRFQSQNADLKKIPLEKEKHPVPCWFSFVHQDAYNKHELKFAHM